jgi:hypothetical protein
MLSGGIIAHPTKTLTLVAPKLALQCLIVYVTGSLTGGTVNRGRRTLRSEEGEVREALTRRDEGDRTPPGIGHNFPLRICAPLLIGMNGKNLTIWTEQERSPHIEINREGMKVAGHDNKPGAHRQNRGIRKVGNQCPGDFRF